MSFAKARNSAGLSVAEAARQLGVTSSAVCQWESGETFPEGRRLSEIAKVYKTTVDELLKEEEDNV